MNLKNYTSSVPVDRSVMLIEHELVRAGATHIAKTYGKEKTLEGIIFQIMGPNGVPLTFQLPSKWDKVLELMTREIRRPRPGTEQRTIDQAQRTAWKILYDWVQIQISMIEIGKADAIEMFLPYLYDVTTDQTFYQRMRETNFKQLTA